MADIWLTFNNQEQGIRLPVMPDSIEASDGSSGNTYEIIGQGEINCINSPKLTEYSFSSIFPAHDYPYVTISKQHFLKPKKKYDAEPNGYVDYILAWMNSKRPIRFTYVGEFWHINEAVSIEGFTWKEVAGSVGDIEYSIKLKKYVFYAAQKAYIISDGASGEVAVRKENDVPPRPDERKPPATYTLVVGDTLWKVAKQTLGDGARWKELQTHNQISDAQIKQLLVGMVLKIPQGG